MRLAIMLRHFDVSANSTTMLRHFDASIDSATASSVTTCSLTINSAAAGSLNKGIRKWRIWKWGKLGNSFFKLYSKIIEKKTTQLSVVLLYIES